MAGMGGTRRARATRAAVRAVPAVTDSPARTAAREWTPRRAVRVVPAEAHVGYLTQEPELVDQETVHQHLARRTGVAAAQAEFDRCSAALSTMRPFSSVCR